MSRHLFMLVEPWLDESVFDNLLDDEANDLLDEYEDKFGIYAPLRKDAPANVKEAYKDLVKEHEEYLRTGLLSD